MSTALPAKHPLLAAIENQTAVIGIVGLGYVGLPLVQAFMNAGFRTMGYDVDESKVDKLREGKSYIGHITGEWIADCIKDERFVPTADMSRLAESDAILICVPTPLSESRDPDLTYVEDTTRMIAKTLRPGQLVVLESTTYPGTTRDVMLPILAATGLKVGEDFFLAYSPEREDPGNIDFSASGIPKVVGGIDSLSAEIANAMYSAGRGAHDPRVHVRGGRSLQDPGKYLSFGEHCHGQRTEDALRPHWHRCLGSDRRGQDEAVRVPGLLPGPGLGGHCIPIDPFYLSWVARKYDMSTRFIELAGEINYLHAEVCDQPDDGSAQQRRQAHARQSSRDSGSGLQERRR